MGADFTSALFLALRHPSDRLGPWASLTTGRPAAVDEPPEAVRLADRLACRQGPDVAGVVHRSALHALWDVVDLAARGDVVLAIDRGAYPLSQWAAAGAAARRIQVAEYAHHDVDDLLRRLRRRPGELVVLTNGWCADCGLPAPLDRLARLTAGTGGMLVVDDTLAVGVLGRSPTPDRPFGSGGSGTLAWLGGDPRSVVQVASLAKAYGAPLTVTTGPVAFVHRLRSHGTRWHSSPPSAVDLAAGLQATRDEAANDRRREHLARQVRSLRQGLADLGLDVDGLPFPMVSIRGGQDRMRHLYRGLRRRGVRTLLRQPGCRPGSALTFAMTADHGDRDVAEVLAILAGAGAPLERAAS